MKRSTTARFVALLASVFITATIVTLIADYSYPEHGVHLASSAAAQKAAKG